MRDDPLPEELQRDEDESGAEDTAPDRSLVDDIGALLEDGQTYVEAELAYQKTRARLIASRGRRGTVLGLVAFAFLNSALIALIVGLVLTLAPILTPLGATAVVVGLLLVGAVFFGLQARKRFRAMSKVFTEERP
mgnify:CR=1 FL=1